MTRYTLPDVYKNPILPPENQDSRTEEVSSLKNDGLPRITSEGVEILKEGIKGDFSRWVWAQGNHPLQIPRQHLRNIRISISYKGKPHLRVNFWFGKEFPVLADYRSMAPNIGFDTLEDNTYFNKRETVELKIAGDFWTSLSILIDDCGKWARERTEEEEHEEEPAPVRSSKALEPKGSLDKWLVFQ